MTDQQDFVQVNKIMWIHASDSYQPTNQVDNVHLSIWTIKKVDEKVFPEENEEEILRLTLHVAEKNKCD